MTTRGTTGPLGPALVLALAGVLGLSACGGDGVEAEVTATTPSTAPAGPADGEPADGTGEAEPGRFSGEGSQPFCAEFTAIQASLGTDPTPEDQAAAAIERAALTAPAEIAGEWETMLSVQAALGDGGDVSAVPPEDLAAYNSARSVIATYVTDVCGVDGPA